MNVVFVESVGHIGMDCSPTMLRGRIGVDGQLLHLLYDRCVGGERFRASVIQIIIIYAQVPFSIVLGDNHNVG